MSRIAAVFHEGMKVYLDDSRTFMVLAPLFLAVLVATILPQADAFQSVTAVYAGFPILYTLAAFAGVVSVAGYGNPGRFESRIIKDREWLEATGVSPAELFIGRTLSMLVHTLMIAILLCLPLVVSSAAAGLSPAGMGRYLGLLGLWLIAFRLYGFGIGVLTPRYPLLGQGLASGGALVGLIALSIWLPLTSPVTTVLYQVVGAAGWTDLIPMDADSGLAVSTVTALAFILAGMAGYTIRLVLMARASRSREAV